MTIINRVGPVYPPRSPTLLSMTRYSMTAWWHTMLGWYPGDYDHLYGTFLYCWPRIPWIISSISIETMFIIAGWFPVKTNRKYHAWEDSCHVMVKCRPKSLLSNTLHHDHPANYRVCGSPGSSEATAEVGQQYTINTFDLGVCMKALPPNIEVPRQVQQSHNSARAILHCNDMITGHKCRGSGYAEILLRLS